jgi:hypothetical protein
MSNAFTGEEMRFRTLLTAIAVGGASLAGPVAHADSYSDMYGTVDYLSHKYGVTAYVDQEPMQYGIYGVTDGDVITFNSYYINNPAQLRIDVTKDVQAGWHPGKNCTPEQGVATHEFGHVLDDLGGHVADARLQQAIANGMTGVVSRYSFTNYQEAVAEGFMAVECDDPTPAEQEIYDMLVN